MNDFELFNEIEAELEAEGFGDDDLWNEEEEEEEEAFDLEDLDEL